MSSAIYSVAFFDPPEIIECSVTPIPASTDPPMQVIADSGINISVGIAYLDTTRRFVGVYTGPAGAEILACIIGNGAASISYGYGKFPAHSRVSLRSMLDRQIDEGKLVGNLVSV